MVTLFNISIQVHFQKHLSFYSMAVLPGYGSGMKIQLRYNGYGQVEMVSGNSMADIIVEEDGTVKLVRTVEPLKIRIKKTDEDGNLLSGAKLSLYVQKEDGTRETVEEVTTDGTAWELTGDEYSRLQVGASCILTEKSAPEGYELAENVMFTVEDNTDWQEYSMMDKRKKKEETEEPKDPENPENPFVSGGQNNGTTDKIEKGFLKEAIVTPKKVRKLRMPADRKQNQNSNTTAEKPEDSTLNAAVLPQTGREARAGFYLAGGM